MQLLPVFALFFWASLGHALYAPSWSVRSFLRQVPRAENRTRQLVARSIPSGWTYVGCVTDGPARALSYSYTSSSMTQDSCIATCDSRGYTFGGTQYGNECWCGNTLANGLGVSAASSDCSIACSGNSGEKRGASYRISLYKKTITWSLSRACVVDTSSRILRGYSVTSSSNTPSTCQSTCGGKGYSIAGVEHGTQCYCASAFIGGNPANASVSDCSIACAGNSALKCGGNWRLQIYTASTANVATKASTSTTTTTSSTTRTVSTSSILTTTTLLSSGPTTTNWALSYACVVDTSSRILQGYSVTMSSNTPTACQDTCAGKGYSMAGVEYGTECYCANSFSGGAPVNAPTSDCSVSCGGNSSLKCGGGWRLQVYNATTKTATSTTTTTTTTSTTATSTSSPPGASNTNWTLSNACLVDTSSRVLQGYSVTVSSNTPTSCQSTCAAKGYKMAGVEYGTECYCANSFSGGTPVNASTSDCSIACGGNSGLKCGGNWRLQVYTEMITTSADATSSTNTTTATNSTPSTNATTITNTTTTTNTTISFSPAPLALGWVPSLSCAIDSANITSSSTAHILQGYTYTSSALTPFACQTACALKGLNIAGVGGAAGNACYCGNAYVGGMPTSANATGCISPCTGDASLACGGPGRVTLYTSTVASIGDVWQTSWDQSTLLSQVDTPSIDFTTAVSAGETDITVDETTVYRIKCPMDGFGGALTDASADLFAGLKTQNSAGYYALLHQLFDITDGSYSAMSNVLRIPLGASDFSDTAWSYCDTSGDTTFSTFSINRTPANVWTVLYDILTINPGIKIYVAPWSPPGWMKDSGTMRGGSLKSNYTSIYPTYLLKALQGFKSKGISIYAISIQNEPMYSDTSYPTATLSATNEAIIGTALRALMNANGFSSVKILGFDHNFGQAAAYPVQLMQEAPTAFTGAAFHCYSGTVSNVDSFKSAFPTKEVHLTECSGVYGTNWWNDIKGYTDNLFVGGPEHNGRSAMMWNLALNSTGGPKLPGSKSCGGSPCRGIVQINADGTWSVNQEFWPIAHAGKAIAPRDAGGAFGTRIGVTLTGTLYWALRVNAYATAPVSAADKTRYSLIVMNWRDYATTAFNATPQLTTINFRGVQATYTFPVGLTTLSWYA